MFTGIVTLDERKFGAVGTPLNGLRLTAGNAALRKNCFNGERLLSWNRLRKGEMQQERADAQRAQEWLHRVAPLRTPGQLNKTDKFTLARVLGAGRPLLQS